MGYLELERLINSLDNSGIPCRHIVINMVIPETDCDFCSSKRAEQQKYIKRFVQNMRGVTLQIFPSFSHEVRGVDDLSMICNSGDTE